MLVIAVVAVFFWPDSLSCRFFFARMFAHSYNQHFVFIIESVCARLVYGAPNKFKKYESSFGFRWFVYSPLFAFFLLFFLFSSVCALEYVLLLLQADKHCMPACLAVDFPLPHLLHAFPLFVVYWIGFIVCTLVFITSTGEIFGKRTKMQTQKTNHPRLISLLRCVVVCLLHLQFYLFSSFYQDK